MAFPRLAPTGIDLSILLTEPMEKYQAQRVNHLSSHQLADYQRCPRLYWKKKQGLIADVDRPAFVLGRAAHTLILEGRQVYENEYCVGGPINPKTGKKFGQYTDAFKSWADTQGKPVLTDDQALLIENLNASVHEHEYAVELLAEGRAEGVLRVNYCGVACQVRFDWTNPQRGIVDLKTCDDLDYLQSDARKYGYVGQMAFYRSALHVATGFIAPVHIIAVEKKEPFRTGVFLLGEDVLGIAQADNEAAIERLKIDTASSTFLTGYEEVRTFDFI